MKKLSTILIAAMLVFGAVGCSKDVKQGSVEKDDKTKTEANKNENNEKESQETEKATKSNGLEKTPLFTNKDLNSKGEIGGVKYNFKAVQVSKIKPYTEEGANLFDVKKDTELTAIVFDVEAENTTGKDITFYIDQSKLITDTKEQVEPNMFLSDHIEAEFLGDVVKKGTLMYILKDSKAEDVNELELRIDAPMDSKTFDKLGDDAKINLKLKK